MGAWELFMHGEGDEDTTKGKDHEAHEGPMTRDILKRAQHSDEDTTKGKDHEALEGPMTRGRLKQAQHVTETRLVICIASIDDD